jgi:hypothetical protein
MLAAIARPALHLDLTPPPAAPVSAPLPPGMDRDKPPRLR